MTELDKCFGKLKQKDHNPIYMIATLLDLTYRMLLEIDQVNHAKRECLKLLNGSDSSGDMLNCLLSNLSFHFESTCMAATSQHSTVHNQ